MTQRVIEMQDLGMGTFSLEGKNYTWKELDTIKEKLFQKINDISNIRNQNASQEFNSNN